MGYGNPGNFIQGAMQNALSIQTNPAEAMEVAQKAFAGSGALALKLVALIDAEEKQRQDHSIALERNIMQKERDIETRANNLRLNEDRDADRTMMDRRYSFSYILE